MKKYSLILIAVTIMLFVFTVTKDNGQVAGPNNHEIKDQVAKESDFDLLAKERIEDNKQTSTINDDTLQGQACTPYSPHGQVLYEYAGSSEIPNIEVINDNYKTATFGLG